MKLSKKFDDALAFASSLHREQKRKGTSIPYISHLLSVCALVIEDGGSEDEAIAALLHDAIEDQGGKTIEQEIRTRFGNTAATIVRACSDTDIVPKPPWRERKEAYLAHLKSASDSAVRVSLADKIHNLRAIVADYAVLGELLWSRFNFENGRYDAFWFYEAFFDAVREKGSQRMVTEMIVLLNRLREMTERYQAPPGLFRLVGFDDFHDDDEGNESWLEGDFRTVEEAWSRNKTDRKQMTSYRVYDDQGNTVKKD